MAGLEACLAGLEACLAGLETCLAGLEVCGLSPGPWLEHMDGRMDVQKSLITGFCPLSGPQLRKELKAFNLELTGPRNSKSRDPPGPLGAGA